MFRFTIRELVLLTLVVAMGVGWWLDRSRLASENQRLVMEEMNRMYSTAVFRRTRPQTVSPDEN